MKYLSCQMGGSNKEVMNVKQLDENIFFYYKSGIHRANFIFNQEGILYQIRDEETNQWGEYLDLPLDSKLFLPPFDIPLIVLWRRLLKVYESGKIETAFALETEYECYLKVSGEVDGTVKEGWIWAKRGKPPLIDLLIVDRQIVGFIMNVSIISYILIKPGYEAMTPLKDYQNPLLSRPGYGTKHLGRFDVKMRDGIKLAAEVWIPAGLPDHVKVPAVLTRTPYGRISRSASFLPLVHYGYAVVSQDVRGREDSEGDWFPHIFEKEDGDDTLNWMAEQPWSNGSIGMIGGSYAGYTQWAAASYGNRHLKAIVSMVTAGRPFVDVKRKGGAYESGSLAWTFMVADRKTNPEAMIRSDWNEVLKIRPLKEIPLKALGREIPFWNEMFSHPDKDDYWKKADWTLHRDEINVPALYISGWYDDNGMGTSEAWEMNQKNNRRNQMLILGPWLHGFNTTREIHRIKFANDAVRYDLNLLYLRWFDRFLKSIPNGVEEEPRVQYYVVGKNQWVKTDHWPPKNAFETRYYLHSNGKARTSNGDGLLKTTPPGSLTPDEFIFDPHDPAPHLINVSENELSVPENYKEVELREDVLVYTSEPLPEDMCIAGDINAVLYAASSARDTDWVVRLTDVDEDGNSIRISDGLIRARYRESFEHPKFLEPGKVEKYEIRMTKIANMFKKGHRIRLEVTSGAENYVFPNHNTGNDPGSDTGFVAATQKIYHDADYSSYVVLPVMVNEQ